MHASDTRAHGNMDGICLIHLDSSDSDSNDVARSSSRKLRNIIGADEVKDTRSKGIFPERLQNLASLINVPPQTNDTIGDDHSGLLKKAEMYQEFMSRIPIPHHRRSIIPFYSWQELGRSVKQIYGQPLHYMTNLLLRQWDQQRSAATTADSIVHPSKAEILIWVSEEVHRQTCSPSHLATVWASDPMYHAYIDPIIPDVLSEPI